VGPHDLADISRPDIAAFASATFLDVLAGTAAHAGVGCFLVRIPPTNHDNSAIRISGLSACGPSRPRARMIVVEKVKERPVINPQLMAANRSGAWVSVDRQILHTPLAAISTA